MQSNCTRRTFRSPRRRRAPRALFVLTALLALVLTSAGRVAAQGTEEALVRQWHDALHSGDVDGALALVADDITVQLVPPPPGMDGTLEGKDELRGWYEGQIAAGAESEILELEAEGDQVTLRETYLDETLRGMGLDEPVELVVTFTVEEGLIRRYTAAMTEASLARLPPPPAALPETGRGATHTLPILAILAGAALLWVARLTSTAHSHNTPNTYQNGEQTHV